MDRTTIKEKGRKKFIREKANSLKEKPARKAPAKTVMRKAGRYRAIEMAKKELNEARQAGAPDQEQQPYSATDRAETFAANTAHEAVRLPVSAIERQIRADRSNSFHHETYLIY